MANSKILTFPRFFAGLTEAGNQVAAPLFPLRKLEIKKFLKNLKKTLDNIKQAWYSIDVGVDDIQGTPVPISNTVVKLDDAENTWLEAAWEDREMPTFFMPFFSLLK